MASDKRQRRSYNEQQQVQHRLVDPLIWRASAGSLIHVPKVNSRVYYFPQGHLEQSSAPVTLSAMVTSRPFVLCRLLHVSLLADPDTDEVLVKYRLVPIKSAPGDLPEGSGTDDNVKNGFASFAKVLTPSDANNGGGFSVPRFCADSIFPPLDFEEDPPVQKLRIADVHGEGWEFRHIYRGTPRRHLLTTGWSKFVNAKKLIAGDSVVFIRKKLTEELFVGIRRAFKTAPTTTNDSIMNWGVLPKPPPSARKGGFSRTNRGRVPPEAVVEAAERAVSDMPFEVVYYPRPGLVEFVVAAEKVEFPWGIALTTGLRVKIAQETDDGSRLTWYNGAVASVVESPVNSPWHGSWWKALQVAWDEPEHLQHMKMVSPWQVEIVSPTPPIHAALGVQNSVLLTDREGYVPMPPVGPSSLMGHFDTSYLVFPAGMQGARQNPHILSSEYGIFNEGTNQGSPDDNVDSTSHKVKGTTDLNIGSSPSSDSQNSVQLGVSFQLFGTIIHIRQALVNEDDISKSTRNAVIKSLSDSYQRFDDSAQSQRSS